MDNADVRRWLTDLEERLDNATWLDEVLEVRDHAALLLDRAFDKGNLLTQAMQRLEPRRRGLLRPPSARRRRLAADVRRILRNARFRLDLDRTDLPGDEAPLGLTAATRDSLLASVDDLIIEVRQSAISTVERDQLLSLLIRAQAILREESDPRSQKAELQQVLGQAVSRAGRPGPAAPLWRRIAELVIVAEAAVSLGLGVGAITKPDATRLEVVCNVEVPALPPAHGAPPREEHPNSDLLDRSQPPELPRPPDGDDLAAST